MAIWGLTSQSVKVRFVEETANVLPRTIIVKDSRTILFANIFLEKGWVATAKLKQLVEAPPMRSLHFCCYQTKQK